MALALAALYLGDGGGRPEPRALRRRRPARRGLRARRGAAPTCPDDARAFVVRTCVVDTLTGPLCDALLGPRRLGSRCSRRWPATGLVLPVDRTGERYRYHRLVRDTLRAELRRREPELEPELHRRASAWHRSRGRRRPGRASTRWPPETCAWPATSSGATSPPRSPHGQTAAVERWLSRVHASTRSRASRGSRSPRPAASWCAARATWSSTGPSAAADAPQPPDAAARSRRASR